MSWPLFHGALWELLALITGASVPGGSTAALRWESQLVQEPQMHHSSNSFLFLESKSLAAESQHGSI